MKVCEKLIFSWQNCEVRKLASLDPQCSTIFDVGDNFPRKNHGARVANMKEGACVMFVHSLKEELKAEFHIKRKNIPCNEDFYFDEGKSALCQCPFKHATFSHQQQMFKFIRCSSPFSKFDILRKIPDKPFSMSQVSARPNILENAFSMSTCFE